jgi:signal transduction histidine kinase
MQIIGSMSIERNIAILAVVLGVVIVVTFAALKITVDNVFFRTATETAYNSARLLVAGIDDPEAIAAGARPSDASTSFLQSAQQAGQAFRYEVFDREGRSRLVSEGGVQRVAQPVISADAARALATNAPVVDVRRQGSPGEPEVFAQALVPVSVDGVPIAVVGASVDQTRVRDAFRTIFLTVAVLLFLLTGVAFAIPAIAWYRRTREKQTADRRADRLAEDAHAQNLRLEGMLANTPHGLCMFDADKCLVLCNARYIELYKLSPEAVRPGTPLQKIVDHRNEVGTGPVDFPNYVTHAGLEWKPEGNSIFDITLQDGRLVRINHLALAGGGYVATHEDVSEVEREALKARVARELAEARAALLEELERKNKELEAFSYSVSHDLRAPLRAIDGFSHAILEDCAGQLDETGQSHIRRVRAAARRMGELIDDILKLSRVTRAEMILGPVDLSSLAREVADDLQRRDPDLIVDIRIDDGLVVEADPRMMKIVLENLIGNAWKFTRRVDRPSIEFGERHASDSAFFVRDNGAGFDMGQAEKLFQPFQRLHSEAEFPGTGIGLATIYRVIDRHGGRVWAEGEVGRGASFFFTIPAPGSQPLHEGVHRV